MEIVEAGPRDRFSAKQPKDGSRPGETAGETSLALEMEIMMDGIERRMRDLENLLDRLEDREARC